MMFDVFGWPFRDATWGISLDFFVISASFCPFFGLNFPVLFDRWPLFRNEKSSHLIHLQILTIFTTVGFGDMSAWTTGETLYADWAMYLGGVKMGMVSVKNREGWCY